MCGQQRMNSKRDERLKFNMKKKYKIKYNDDDTLIELNGYGIQEHIVALYYPDVTENLEGFILYNPDGTILKDCSDFKYRYDILENDSKSIYYTDLNDMVQYEKWNRDYTDTIDEEPLTNEELTECVADLMYEASLIQLGIGG